MGLSGLSEYLDHRVTAPIRISATPPRRYPFPGPGLEAFTRPPAHTSVKKCGAPSLRLRLPFRVLPTYRREHCTEISPSAKPTPSEVPSPTTSFQPHGATYTQWDPTHRLRCALRFSQPLDALLPVRSIGLVSSRIRPWGFPCEALTNLRCRTPFRAPRPP